MKSLAAGWSAGTSVPLSQTFQNLMSNLQTDTETSIWRFKSDIHQKNVKITHLFVSSDLYWCWAYHRTWARSVRTRACGRAARMWRYLLHHDCHHTKARTIKNEYPAYFQLELRWCKQAYLKFEGENTPIQSSSLGWGVIKSTFTQAVSSPCEQNAVIFLFLAVKGW